MTEPQRKPKPGEVWYRFDYNEDTGEFTLDQSQCVCARDDRYTWQHPDTNIMGTERGLQFHLTPEEALGAFIAHVIKCVIEYSGPVHFASGIILQAVEYYLSVKQEERQLA